MTWKIGSGAECDATRPNLETLLFATKASLGPFSIIVVCDKGKAMMLSSLVLFPSAHSRYVTMSAFESREPPSHSPFERFQTVIKGARNRRNEPVSFEPPQLCLHRCLKRDRCWQECSKTGRRKARKAGEPGAINKNGDRKSNKASSVIGVENISGLGAKVLRAGLKIPDRSMR